MTLHVETSRYSDPFILQMRKRWLRQNQELSEGPVLQRVTGLVPSLPIGLFHPQSFVLPNRKAGFRSFLLLMEEQVATFCAHSRTGVSVTGGMLSEVEAPASWHAVCLSPLNQLPNAIMKKRLLKMLSSCIVEHLNRGILT